MARWLRARDINIARSLRRAGTNEQSREHRRKQGTVAAQSGEQSREHRSTMRAALCSLSRRLLLLLLLRASATSAVASAVSAPARDPNRTGRRSEPQTPPGVPKTPRVPALQSLAAEWQPYHRGLGHTTDPPEWGAPKHGLALPTANSELGSVIAVRASPWHFVLSNSFSHTT